MVLTLLVSSAADAVAPRDWLVTVIVASSGGIFTFSPIRTVTTGVAANFAQRRPLLRGGRGGKRQK